MFNSQYSQFSFYFFLKLTEYSDERQLVKSNYFVIQIYSGDISPRGGERYSSNWS